MAITTRPAITALETERPRAEPMNCRKVTGSGIVSQTSSRGAPASSGGMEFTAIIATEHQTLIWDKVSKAIYDEVLLMRGMKMPSQVPLLDNHLRISTECVLGSVSDFQNEGVLYCGRCRFTPNVQAAQDAWLKVAAGDLTDVSIGYTTKDYQDYPVGQRPPDIPHARPRGYPIRVVTEWQLNEVSLVPIGADSYAKINNN